MDCVGDADWNAMGDGREGMVGVRDVLDGPGDGVKGVGSNGEGESTSRSRGERAN